MELRSWAFRGTDVCVWFLVPIELYICWPLKVPFPAFLHSSLWSRHNSLWLLFPRLCIMVSLSHWVGLRGGIVQSCCVKCLRRLLVLHDILPNIEHILLAVWTDILLCLQLSSEFTSISTYFLSFDCTVDSSIPSPSLFSPSVSLGIPTHVFSCHQ